MRMKEQNMGHRQDVLAQVAEGVEDVYTMDEAEAEAREAISDAIVEYERLLCREEIEELVAPFTHPEAVFDEDLGIVQATEEDFADLDAVFDEADQRYAVKDGRKYRFSAIDKRPATLAARLYASQMDVAGRFVTAGEIGDLGFLSETPYDPMSCPVCLSANTTMVYEEAFADTYMCNDCGKSFSVDKALSPEPDPACDVIEFCPDIEARISIGPDGVFWCVTLGGIDVSEGTAQGYGEALDHCQAWYDRYIGISEGDVFASAHTGSTMRITGKADGKIAGVRIDTGAPFEATASAFVGQIERSEIIKSARHDLYADVAERGSQYQALDGNVIEVVEKEAGMVQYADTASDASMFNAGATKWLPTQEFYAMIDRKGYAAI